MLFGHALTLKMSRSLTTSVAPYLEVWLVSASLVVERALSNLSARPVGHYLISASFGDWKLLVQMPPRLSVPSRDPRKILPLALHFICNFRLFYHGQEPFQMAIWNVAGQGGLNSGGLTYIRSSH